VQFDQELAADLHDQATPALTTAFKTVTVFGNAGVLVPATVLGVVLLAWRRRIYDATLLGLAVIGAELLTLALKLGFERERPFFPDPLATASGFSFPSGHATASLAFYGALAVLGVRRFGSLAARATILGGAVLFVLAIGFSRMYLGVHFLSDVLAGFSVGLAWLTLCVLALHLQRVRRSA
jgi:undecaprenyl-diphosphatase